MRLLLTFIVFAVLPSIFVFGQHEEQIDTRQMDVIKDSLYPDGQGKQSFHRHAQFKGITVHEDWSYYSLSDRSYHLTITFRYEEIEYQEFYWVWKGDLIGTYVAEDSYNDGFDKERTISWSYDCGMEDGNLEFQSSNGHGRSERDTWDGLEEVLEFYDKRKNELVTLLPK